MTRASLSRALAVAFAVFGATTAAKAETPRPEHPTPDAVRPYWSNLNGKWQFRLDPRDEGRAAGWQKPGAEGFDKTITVPFPWESQLSGVALPDYHGVAWYRREFRVPAEFPADQRVWLRFGAVDWRAEVWVNGTSVATHEGGYTPFEADVTDALKSATPGGAATVVVRVFDPTDPAEPTGKQVGWYTTTSGIWQTVWLESRPAARIEGFTATTVLDPKEPATGGVSYTLRLAGLKPGGVYDATVRSSGASTDLKFTATAATAEVNLGGPKWTRAVYDTMLWSPENPRLHDATLELKAAGGSTDTVQTYFGLRTISRGRYGDEPYERILLNGKPVYLRTALDQSFNPKGVYTAPDDEFLKRDLMIAKQNGLNGLRVHIKPDEPRRLYWADRIGLLILEDMPNTWRQNARARAAWEATMRDVVRRDRNHPAVVAWVAFNETWGLGSAKQYAADKDTQEWVGRMVSEVRALDPTRLVEDNSPCNYDHVENTDLNSWHFYIDDHDEADAHVKDVVARTAQGSGFNYCPGRVQGTAPLINSEYGGVSAGGGDRDVSWCFRDLTTILRRQPKVQGYVYTELTDIEWEHNGFADYDRGAKEFGYGAFVPDMRPSDLNGADFIGYGGPPALVVRPGATVTVPVFLSHYSEVVGPPIVRWWVDGWDDEANSLMAVAPASRPAVWVPYDVTEQAPLSFKAPNRPFVGSINLTLRDGQNRRLAANYVNLVVRPDAPLPRAERRRDNEAVLRFSPADYARRQWSAGVAPSTVKAAGRGRGFFEYRLKLPAAVAKAIPESFELRFQMASKGGDEQVDWPGHPNGQDYPQTDAKKWPSAVVVTLNGKQVAREVLEDDPADARGVLSHLNGVDHGSYGELIEANGPLPDSVRDDLAGGKTLVLRLTVPEDAPAGGLCLFGAEAGQYPFDPTVVIHTRDPLPSDLGVAPGTPVALDSLASRRVEVLATGESKSPTTWAYTTADPGRDWQAADFDDKVWSRGPAGFGTAQTPAIKPHTRWDTPHVWLRTSFDLPALKADDVLTLRFFHDEDLDVTVNGEPLLKRDRWVSSYQNAELDARQRALFHPGKNVIAVSCRQNNGGQGVDLGLTLQKGD